MGRGKLTNALGIPWNALGVPSPLMAYLNRNTPITLVDVGASQGNFTASIEKYCGIRSAILIEPQPCRAAEISARFRGDRFRVIQAAVADQEAEMKMQVLNWDYASSLLPIRNNMPGLAATIDLNVKETINVRVATLDTLCSSLDRPIDLLKIDVQGAEHLALVGGWHTLRRTRMIWMELSLQSIYDGSASIEQMIGLCREHGFSLRRLEEGFASSAGELLQVDSLFLRD